MCGSPDTSWEERLPLPIQASPVLSVYCPPGLPLPIPPLDGPIRNRQWTEPIKPDSSKNKLPNERVCVLGLALPLLIWAPPTSSSPELSNQIVSDFCFSLFFFRLSLCFCLYDVELKKLSEFYGGKRKTSPESS